MAATSFFGGEFFGGEFFNIVTVAVRPSGGIPRDYPGPRRRTEEEVRAEREAFGILPRTARIIEDIARRQVEDFRLDEQQRLEELARELALQKIEWESRYLELLNARREALIDDEIEARLRQKLLDEENIMVLLLLASTV